MSRPREGAAKGRRQPKLPFMRVALGTATRAWMQREATRFAAYVGCGMRTRDWWRALRENRFAVDPGYLHWLALVLGLSVVNEFNAWRQRRAYGDAIRDAQVEPPLIVLGHWRSGTTLLHEMLSLDDRWAFPNLFQVVRPHTFLVEEAVILDHLKHIVPDTRPMDNMGLPLDGPAEDEWGITQLTMLSPLVGFFFPRSGARYDRYLDLRGLPEGELAAWKAGFRRSMAGLTVRHRRRLVLKSPPHTGRVQQILECYPDAQFVHVCRNPYHVYRSTVRLYHTGISILHLQHVDDEQILEGVMRRYRITYDAYLETRDVVPPGQLCEVRFEDLERDKVGQMARIYEELGLGGFDAVSPRLRAYARDVADYRKNTYDPLPEAERERVAREWARCFEAFGYEP